MTDWKIGDRLHDDGKSGVVESMDPGFCGPLGRYPLVLYVLWDDGNRSAFTPNEKTYKESKVNG